MKKSILNLLLICTIALASCSKDDSTPPAGPEDVVPVKGSVTYINMTNIDDKIAYDERDGKTIIDALNPIINEYYDATAKSDLDQVISVVNYNNKYRAENNIKGTEYYHYKGGKRVVLESTPTIEKIGEDSKYLTKLLDLAVSVAPAETYVLIFNSHGGGWDWNDAVDPITRSTAIGEDSGGKGLTVNRLIQGYKNSKMGKVGKKIKAIYYDCCIMHTIENVSETGVVAEYSIGSPNFTYGVTNSHLAFINNVRDNINDFERGIIMTAELLQKKWSAMQDVYVIAQVIKLSESAKIPALVDPIVAKILTAAENPTMLEKMKKIRSSAFCYNMYNWDDKIQQNDTAAFPLYDMGDFLYRFKEVINDASYDALYNTFHAAAKQAILYSKPSNEAYSLNLAGKLAEGNTNYMFSVLVCRTILGDKSPYIGTAYKTLRLNTEGKWLKLLEKLDCNDDRLLPNCWGGGNVPLYIKRP